MSISAKKSRLSHDNIAQTSTIFDFLKQNKIINLDTSRKKTNKCQSLTKKKYADQYQQDFPQIKTSITKSPNGYLSNRSHLNNKSNHKNITPTKINFNNKINNYQNQNSFQQQLHKHPSFGRNFMTMISPIKNINHDKSSKKLQGQLKQSVSDRYSKQKINNVIIEAKKQFIFLNEKMKNAKDKLHAFNISFGQLTKKISQENPQTNKLIGELKNKILNLQNYFTTEQSQNKQSFENLLKNIEQHLQFQEGKIKSQYDNEKYNEIMKIKYQKQQIIDKLMNENKLLQKQIQSLERKNNKYQNQLQTRQQLLTQRQLNFIEQNETLKKSYQQKIKQLSQKLQNIIINNKQQMIQLKNLKQQLKLQKYQRQKQSQKHRLQIKQVNQSKQQYYINQIMILKTQFNNDINKISQLNKLKQLQMELKIKKYQQQLQKTNFNKKLQSNIQNKILQQANIVKQQNIKLKNKNQCIINDMCRLNQELFHHWIALKDIKILSQRLNIYPSFKKIYEELMFNDILFK